MKKNIFVFIVVALLIVAGGTYYWWQSKSSATNPTTAEVKVVLDKLSKHILLPTGEDPQIGRIDDPAEAVKAQPFVAGSQKGDLLIIYVKAAKAIVYSPERDIIVNVGPVSVNPNQNEPLANPKTTETKDTATKR